MTDTRGPTDVRRQRTSTFKQSTRWLIVAINIAEAVAGLAGLFTDQVLHRLRRTKEAGSRES